jgi:putative membrane protein
MIVSGKVGITSVLLGQRRQIATVLLVSLCVVGLHEVLGERWVSIQITPLTALGVALGVFLSLRNNVVYDRYWEARTLWGRLVNASRTLLRQLTTFLPESGITPQRDDFYRDMARGQIAFVRSLRAHLRDDADPHDGLDEWVACPKRRAELRDARNVPAALLQQMGEQLHRARHNGLLSEFHLVRFDETLTECTEILGGCERIKNTPLPPAYTYLAHKIVLFYCCLIPFGLVADIQLLTPILSVAISFAFLTLDQISDLIEAPFSRKPNDLPLDALTRTIEIDTLQRLGEQNLPAALEPVNGVLL